MPFEALAGNRPSLDRLRGIIRSGRVAHAYLFAGPDGVGKKLAALDFARALGAAPLLVTRPEGKREILIEQVREVIRELGFTSLARRAMIFDEAERLNEEGMNALLKTLEEPPRDTVLILVSAIPHRLLATIRSRCQTILFFPLPDEEVARLVREKAGLPAPSATLAAMLAEGSPGAALALAGGMEEVQAEARELQERVLSGELNPLIESLGKIKDTEQARRSARRRLALLAECLRDALRSRSGIAPRLAGPAFVERFVKVDEDDLLDRIEILLDRQHMIDQNANVALAVEDALLRL